MANDRQPWGDPKWHMRRTIMLSVFAYCGFLIVFAFFWPPERVDAVSNLVTAVAVIVMPVLLAYLGIAEAGSIIKETRTTPISRVTATTTVEEVKAPKANVGQPPPPE